MNSAAEKQEASEDIAARLRAALARNEFCLYGQAIMPATRIPSPARFFEILIRLNEEERNMTPPGAFLQLAEEHGVLPDLDRWVVRHLLDLLAGSPMRQSATYSVNIAGATLSDPTFPAYVVEQVAARSLRELTLCFEFPEAEAAARINDAIPFIRRLRRGGFLCALSGFGSRVESFDLLKALPVDFLKIDSGIVLALHRSATENAKVRAINRAAHAAGIKTIAECVEDDRTFDMVCELEVDFAQGFGIAHPKRLGTA